MLDPRLEKSSYPVCKLALCEVRLNRDSRYPWLVLVPIMPDITEIHQLTPPQQVQLISEITHVSTQLQQQTQGFKMNVAALGNQVAQLHVHIVARFKEDAAWPDPIWGKGTSVPYAEADKDQLIADLKVRLLG
jgi:diadenosine tetraphosphate (Ap4A) HIT family hydrolase